MIIGIGASGDAVRGIQRALISAGHVLVADGEFGPITEVAVKRFQAAHGLAVVGYVGPKTSQLLIDGAGAIPSPDVLRAPSVLKVAPWLAQMRAITGTKEIPGKQNSPIIMSWASDIVRAFPDLAKYTASYTGDEIPWCGYGLAGCMARAGIRPSNEYMWAQSWAQWGTKLKQPITGCVMVFKRAGGGHVSLLEYHDKKEGLYYIRGCNQSDTVNVAHRRVGSDFIAAVWPSTWPVITEIMYVTTNSVPSSKEA